MIPWGSIFLAVVQGVVAVAPGLIAEWTSHQTDAEAIAVLTEALKRVPEDPVHDAVTSWKDRVRAARAKLGVTIADVSHSKS